MATLYSNLYTRDTSSASGYGYKAPASIPLPGVLNVTYGTYVGAIASDTLKLMKGPLGAKVHRITLKASADGDSGNDFTVNIGNTTSATAYASAVTILQAATGGEAAVIACIDAAAFVAGDEVLVARAAGALETSVTIRFAVEWYIP